MMLRPRLQPCSHDPN